MAFVNEPMGEAGVELIRSLNLPTPSGCGGGMYFDTFRPHIKDVWTTDNERNLRFFEMCGAGCDREHPPIYCCLIWNGKPIRIDAYRYGKGSNTIGVDVVWEIERINPSVELKNIPAEQIRETIKEAFSVYTKTIYGFVKSISFPSMSDVRFTSNKTMWR